MSIAYISGWPAFLPMDSYEMEQFLYGLGLDGPGVKHDFEIVDGIGDYPIDWGTDFRIANRLVQRVSDMGDLRDTFKAWCDAQDNCTVEDALKASSHMNSVMFLHGVDSDEILGEFALENGMILEYNDLPDEVYEALDKAKAGAKLREMEGGVFVNGGYLINEDFSDELLPAEEPLAYFQVRFSDEHHDSGWCDVPLSEADGRLITRMFNCENLSELPMENRSIVPQLNGIVSGADELPELNLLNEAFDGMNSEEIQKYKVLLEVIQPGTPLTALRLADDMAHYDVELQYVDPSAYGRQYIDERYNFNEQDSLLLFIDYEGFGAAILSEDGYQATRYGAVYVGDEEQEIIQDEEQGFGGMGGMA